MVSTWLFKKKCQVFVFIVTRVITGVQCLNNEYTALSDYIFLSFVNRNKNKSLERQHNDYAKVLMDETPSS